MTEFINLGLSKRVIQAVEKENYSTPTPIQQKLIPHMLDGKDIVGTAQTGTGKTAAFVLPLLHRLDEGRRRAKPRTCSNLIVVPTRELATQIFQNIATYGRFIPHSKTVVMGGAKAGAQIKALARGLDIVIATPGRLEDHLSTNSISLKETQTVILDEADQMMDLGFFPAIRRIMGFLPDGHQTLLLSATMPKQVRGLANEFLNNPIDLSIGQQSKPIEKINQKILLVDRPKKKQLLVEILTDVFKAIVFTRTKHGADKIVRYLREKGIDSTAIHGNKSQGQRQRSLDMFKKDKINILVATDIAARGIDIDEVSHVVNFDMPNIPESYVHRIGRTARAGNDGIAISLCDNSEVDYLKDIEKLINQKLPREKILEDGSRKEVFYDPMDDKDPSLKINKSNSRSRHRKKSSKGKRSKNFQPQIDKEVNKSSVKSGKKKIKKKKNKKFYTKLEKIKNVNSSDEFVKDNSGKKSDNFKSSKQKSKTRSKKSYKNQPRANDRPRKKIK